MKPTTTATHTTTTNVIYVRRHDAKFIKTWLENDSCLDKRFRMSPVDDFDTDVEVTRLNHDDDNQDNDVGDTYDDDACRNHRGDRRSTQSPPLRLGDNCDAGDIMKDCIAVPVTEKFVERLLHRCYNYHDAKKIIAYGRYNVPFSSSMLGNNNTRIVVKNTSHHTSDSNGHRRTSSSNNPPLTNVQHVLIEALTSWLQHLQCDNGTIKNFRVYRRRSIDDDVSRIETLTRRLSNRTCPRKLEIIGDDRTVVIPRWSFFVDDNQGIKSDCNSHRNKSKTNQNERNSEFRELLVNLICGRTHDNYHDDGDDATSNIFYYEMQSLLWEKIATHYQCSRVVRRGDIDPESGVRESGHKILWPTPQDDECNLGYVPASTGLDSPGWITVTEHGIRQSYDLTRVMFSRGNVTEKKRFGVSCVRGGENILDMYAGIGYYTLPALILGKARHVTACEWNEHALYALRYNLAANGVGEDRATVLEGDCRVSLKRLLMRGDASFDRISLGLLPSSEGGWAVAASCLNRSIGGWLHVHGNVPTMERVQWTNWLCQSLVKIAAMQRRPRRRNYCRADSENDCCDATSADDGNSEDNDDEWIAVIRHVERVKSFAPMVDHVVADVFVGPRYSPKAPAKETGVFDSSGMFAPISPLFDIPPPSCALNEEGILHQNWLIG